VGSSLVLGYMQAARMHLFWANHIDRSSTNNIYKQATRFQVTGPAVGVQRMHNACWLHAGYHPHHHQHAEVKHSHLQISKLPLLNLNVRFYVAQSGQPLRAQCACSVQRSITDTLPKPWTAGCSNRSNFTDRVACTAPLLLYLTATVFTP